MPHMPQVSKVDRKTNPEGVMSIGDHLRELRHRLLIAVGAILVGAVVGYFFSTQAINLLQSPLEAVRATGRTVNLNFDTLTGAFDLRLRVSLWLGLLGTSPIWIYQLWAYMAPGMTRKEKRYAWGYGIASVLLFASGVALGILIMPHAVLILMDFLPTTTSGLLQYSYYFSFVMRLLLVFGIAFLLPELLVALNQLGILKGRTMLKGWRWAVVFIFAFMAVANPLPDPWSMILMALPICGLYFGACWLSIRHDKRQEKKRARLDAELDAALSTPKPTGVSALPTSAPQAQAAPALPAAEQPGATTGELPPAEPQA
ncbi:twin-arginine translocase subunit TatC [Actinomyces radicidentis]|uniref:twin-arginine translocase subunit TatC n=1 Tax=Actinomyces radicidentis TaxID=111015 RepID=UPI0026E02426|nr:twin-arginine translocase subunit TatC [Actinomyces radicidentis]